jgi:hypothetical protein
VLQGTDTPRSVLAHLVARHLVASSNPETPEISPVRAGIQKLDKLLAAKQIPESEYRQLLYLLRTLEGCDSNRCEWIDDLVQEVTTSLTVWPEVFPDQELERLRDLL